jgi:hypothetical protein
MSLANTLSGAPRIHGELLKLGIEVSKAWLRAQGLTGLFDEPLLTARSSGSGGLGRHERVKLQADRDQARRGVVSQFEICLRGYAYR